MTHINLATYKVMFPHLTEWDTTGTIITASNKGTMVEFHPWEPTPILTLPCFSFRGLSYCLYQARFNSDAVTITNRLCWAIKGTTVWFDGPITEGYVVGDNRVALRQHGKVSVTEVREYIYLYLGGTDPAYQGFGSWYDTDSDTYYIGPVRVTCSTEQCRQWMYDTHELYVYDLQTNECVSLSGIEDRLDNLRDAGVLGY